MNIFVTSPSPVLSAQALPDKHIVKMPLETCQMLSIVASEQWGYGFGTLPKADGTPYNTARGAFRNHPCTIWAGEFVHNWRWLIDHGLALCAEYTLRYGKVHACERALHHASDIFPTADPTGRSGSSPTPFVRAMPDDLKSKETIDTFEAYRLYLNTKTWIYDNYLRLPARRPDWIINPN